MYILADIGGTKMRIAASDDLSRFKEPVIYDTPRNFEEGAELIARAAKTFANGEDIKRAVFGLPGILNEERHGLFHAPNLHSWEGKDIKGSLEERLNCLVYLENDTSLVGLGEAHFGAGKDFPVLGYITVSTGVGGVRIIDGEIDKSKYGFEPGHQIISYNGEEGDLESFVSGTAISKRFGKQPKEIQEEAVWDELAEILSLGLYNLILSWSPDCIVLGGSMFNEVGIKIDKVAEYLKEKNKVFPTIPIIKHSELGDLGGLYGGLAYLKSFV